MIVSIPFPLHSPLPILLPTLLFPLSQCIEQDLRYLDRPLNLHLSPTHHVYMYHLGCDVSSRKKGG